MNAIIDVQTLGIESNTMILSIGAVAFDMKTNYSDDVFYRKIDIDSYEALRIKDQFSIDQSTLSWWMTKAPKSSRDEAFSLENRVSILDAINDLCTWFRMQKITKVWSHGASFDIAIVTYTMNVLNLKTPWDFWNVRDTRTLYDLAKVNYLNYEVINNLPEHHPLVHCFKEIMALRSSYAILHRTF
jgi:hypothetical protein